MSPKHCPICAVKKYVRSKRLNQPVTEKYNNGVALTPPMGWSSWNLFKYKINEDLIKEIAEAMAKSGLGEAGYKYVNIDDCWQNSSRDENGKLQTDFITFPSGIKNLNTYINSLGLKLGIYSSNGTHTCEDYPASLGNEKIDADTFAEWGVEYFKYDFCHNVPVPTIAPFVVKISVGEKYGKDFYEAVAEKAKLSGSASLVKDKDVEGGYYISGLDGKKAAVCVFNTGKGRKKVKIQIDKLTSFADVNIEKKEKYNILNCWTDEKTEGKEILTLNEKHGCEVFIVS